MKLPNRFEDITLAQFIEIDSFINDKTVEEIDKNIKILSILSGESIENIENMDMAKLKQSFAKVSYIYNPPTNLPVKKCVYANGMFLIPTLSLNEMKVNQLVDFYSLHKANNGNHIGNAHELLATVYTPFKAFNWSKYKVADKRLTVCNKIAYSPDNHAKVAKALLGCKVGDVLGTLFFYSDYLSRCEPIIVDYTMKANQTLQNHFQEIMNDKEFQDFLNNGDGNITLINAEKTLV